MYTFKKVAFVESVTTFFTVDLDDRNADMFAVTQCNIVSSGKIKLENLKLK